MFQNFETTADKTATPERIAAVRAEMASIGVNGFIVPRADAHQGENVAPRDERLAWVTGFTGSAGTAIILADRAALFVDGRYTLQAASQIVTELYEIVPIHEKSPAEWLSGTTKAGDRIGYDPWLHGRSEVERLRAGAKQAGAELTGVSDNPIDLAWTDQPPPPAGSVRIHPLEIAGETAAAKRATVAELVAAAGAQSVVLTLPDSIAWLLNIRGSDILRAPVPHGFAVLHRDALVDLIMDPDKIDGDVRAHLGNEVTLHHPEMLEGLVADLTGTILLDEARCPLWFADKVKAAGAELVWGQDPCILPKARKNRAELDGMRAAHIRDGAAVARFLHWLDTALAGGETLTEIDVVERLETFRRERGDLEDISFETICGSGPNGAIVHYRVTRDTNRTVQPGDLLLIDSGGQYPDGTTDITRTIATGHVSDRQRREVTLVLKGMIAISQTRWPKGIRGRDLDPLARAALWREGLDFDHGTGHGVGACLCVHEGPQSLSRRGEAVLEPGMILSNEPGYYVEGSHGIRIENLLIVTAPEVPAGGTRPMLGFETLTWAPIDRRLIDASLLTADECEWLDRYHADVLAKIGPLVDAQVRTWLEQACSPLAEV
ncbi:MAG: aminopeptidase P family protein [Pseudomonadota bacterium]